MGNYIMPTTATKIESIIEFNEDVVNVRLFNVFFNHWNGANKGVQYIAGFDLFPLPAEETTNAVGHGSDSANKVVKTDDTGQIFIYTNSIKRPGHVANKEYVDSGLSKKVDVSRVGQTVGEQGQIVARAQGGNITVPNEPTSDNHAASKKYVDVLEKEVKGITNRLLDGSIGFLGGAEFFLWGGVIYPTVVGRYIRFKVSGENARLIPINGNNWDGYLKFPDGSVRRQKNGDFRTKKGTIDNYYRHGKPIEDEAIGGFVLHVDNNAWW